MARIYVHDTQSDFIGTNRNTEVTTEGAVKLLPLSDLVFNRDSSAYVLGASTSQDVPRYENGAFNQAIVVEENTINKLGSIDFQSGWSNVTGSGATGNRSYTVDGTYGNVATITRTNNTSTYFGIQNSVSGLSENIVNFSVYVKALNTSGNLYLELVANTTPNNVGNVTKTFTQSWALSSLPQNTWKRISIYWDSGRFSFTGNGTATIALADGTGSVSIALPQIELKNFPTRFQNPSTGRERETLYTIL